MSLWVIPLKLSDYVRRKRPDLWKSGDWVLHHDNAPAHSLRLIQQFLMKHEVSHLYQPPHNPDRAPCDFWLFPKLKKPLKGKEFEIIEGVKVNVTKRLLSIKKNLRKKVVALHVFFCVEYRFFFYWNSCHSSLCLFRNLWKSTGINIFHKRFKTVSYH